MTFFHPASFHTFYSGSHPIPASVITGPASPPLVFFTIFLTVFSALMTLYLGLLMAFDSIPVSFKVRARMGFYRLVNRFKRRREPSIIDYSTGLVMGMCSLQLDPRESVSLAATGGSAGAFTLSGGMITKVRYKVFDRHADKVDRAIRQEPWRAFAAIEMIVTTTKAPEFTVTIDGHEVDVKEVHKAPGLALLKRTYGYFPLLPKAYTGPVFAPMQEALK